MKNKIRETGDLSDIPDSTPCLGFINLLITNSTDLSIRNNLVQPIRS